MNQSMPVEFVFIVGAAFGFIAAYLLLSERREKIRADAIREYIANQKGRIIPPRGGSGCCPPKKRGG